MLHLERRARDKHSRLLQKSVNDGQKSFITLAPEIIIVYDEDVPFGRTLCFFKFKVVGKNESFDFERQRRRIFSKLSGTGFNGGGGDDDVDVDEEEDDPRQQVRSELDALRCRCYKTFFSFCR